MDDHDQDDRTHDSTMEEGAEGGASSRGGTTTTRSYECTFCKRGFSNAQALGGHMNIHRKDKAKLKHSSSSSSSNHNYSTTTYSNEAVGYPNLAVIHPTHTAWSWVVNDTTTHDNYYPNYSYIVPAATAAQQQLLPNLFVPQPPASLANYDHQFGPDHRRGSRRSSGASTSELDLELRLGTMDPHRHHHRHQPDLPAESSSSTILGTRKFF